MLGAMREATPCTLPAPNSTGPPGRCPVMNRLIDTLACDGIAGFFRKSTTPGGY
jgi:hypothetical protein